MSAAAGCAATVRAVPADVTTASGVRAAVDAALGAFGGVDILVNNVGGSTGTSFLETSEEDWQRAIDLNLLPAVRASRLVVPAMRARGRGAIVNIVSIYGREWGGAYVRRPTYIAAKAAEIGMSKALAMELAPFGIRVNAVAPGSIVFPGGGWERRTREDPDGIAAFLKADLVDEAMLFRAADSIGANGLDALQGLPLEALTRSPRLALISSEPVGVDMLEHYERR